MSTYTEFSRLSLVAKIRLREKFTSEIFYRWKYPDLRYTVNSYIALNLQIHWFMSGSCTLTLKKCSLSCFHSVCPPLPAWWSSPRRGWAWPEMTRNTPPTLLRCTTWQTKVLKLAQVAFIDWHPYSISLSLSPASYTGQAEDSHTDTITALDASPKLKLFASCSKDCTVRIWSEDNHPVRYSVVQCLPSQSRILSFTNCINIFLACMKCVYSS